MAQESDERRTLPLIQDKLQLGQELHDLVLGHYNPGQPVPEIEKRRWVRIAVEFIKRYELQCSILDRLHFPDLRFAMLLHRQAVKEKIEEKEDWNELTHDQQMCYARLSRVVSLNVRREQWALRQTAGFPLIWKNLLDRINKQEDLIEALLHMDGKEQELALRRETHLLQSQVFELESRIMVMEFDQEDK